MNLQLTRICKLVAPVRAPVRSLPREHPPATKRQEMRPAISEIFLVRDASAAALFCVSAQGRNRIFLWQEAI
jgi:hypothetical protein